MQRVESNHLPFDRIGNPGRSTVELRYTWNTSIYQLFWAREIQVFAQPGASQKSGYNEEWLFSAHSNGSVALKNVRQHQLDSNQ